MTTRKAASTDSAERIIEEATRLFAQHGYDGVSTRAIAAAVDLNIATVHYHVGGKQALYDEVFQRAFREEEAVLHGLIGDVDDAVLKNIDALRDLLESVVEGFLALTQRRPDIARLYMRRWLEQDRRLMENYYSEFSVPLHRIVHTLLERAHQFGTIDITHLDVPLFIQGFTWMHYGYFVTGPVDWSRGRVDPLDENEIERFHRFLCDYLCQMLNLPPREGT